MKILKGMKFVNNWFNPKNSWIMLKPSLIILTLFFSFSTQLLAQNFRHDLKSKAEFDSLAGPPLANKYGNVTAVKIVFDLSSEILYYLDAGTYKNHYVFCEKELNYLNGMGNFLKHNYSDGTERKFLLANLNYFHATKEYVAEISPLDQMGIDQIIQISSLIENSFYGGDDLLFLTNSPRLQGLDSMLSENLKTISPDEIYGDQHYQAISKYKNTGKLRIVENIEKEFDKIRPTDIIVLKNIPNYLPAVAGVIVTEFQTPLSHIAILGQNRKIPICAYTKIFELEKIYDLQGKGVSLEVCADTFYIAAEKTNRPLRKDNEILLEMNLAVDTLIDVEYMDASSSSYVGSKAANFAELYHLSKTANFKTPESAFAIPFYFYQQHIEQSGTQILIDKLTNRSPKKPKRLKKDLEKIRAGIEQFPVSAELIASVENKIAADGSFQSFRFRSSTNAEDIEGFSGAGLYTSKTGKLNSNKKSVEKAIQEVWASLWLYQAYMERAYFNIDQKKLGMGILVHRSFPNELVNGVAITKNIYRKNSNGFLINAQLGYENVVDPSPGVTCDQFICFPSTSNKLYKDKTVIDVITYSSLNNNKLVMSEEEIQHLADQLAIIKKHFAGPDVGQWTYIRIGYDIEFKLDNIDRQLYIKQIRPYND